jgi:hypothetical protein
VIVVDMTITPHQNSSGIPESRRLNLALISFPDNPPPTASSEGVLPRDHNMVEALTPDRSDEPSNMTILRERGAVRWSRILIRLSDLDSELEQFTMDAWGALQRVLPSSHICRLYQLFGLSLQCHPDDRPSRALPLSKDNWRK